MGENFLSWGIEAEYYLRKMKEQNKLTEVKLCPIARDYCLPEKCVFSRSYKTKGIVKYECSFINLVRNIVNMRFLMKQKQ